MWPSLQAIKLTKPSLNYSISFPVGFDNCTFPPIYKYHATLQLKLTQTDQSIQKPIKSTN